MASYATLAELRAAPYSVTLTEADDPTATAMLEVASRVVDNYTHRTFDSGISTKNFYDFHGRVLNLSVPFSAITSLKVEGTAVTEYEVESWGILFDWNQSGDVAVTATFGFSAAPSPVKRATLLIAAAMIRNTVEDSGEQDVQTQSAEGYSVSYQQRGTEEASSATTGVTEADRLLDPYKLSYVG